MTRAVPVRTGGGQAARTAEEIVGSPVLLIQRTACSRPRPRDQRLVPGGWSVSRPLLPSTRCTAPQVTGTPRRPMSSSRHRAPLRPAHRTDSSGRRGCVMTAITLTCCQWWEVRILVPHADRSDVRMSGTREVERVCAGISLITRGSSLMTGGGARRGPRIAPRANVAAHRVRARSTAARRSARDWQTVRTVSARRSPGG